jgi:hypothetical protein
MSRRTRCAILVILAILVPGSVRAEDPPDAAGASPTPWAAVRETLREQSRLKPPFSGSRPRKRHKQVPAAVESALTWLAARQSSGGGWEAARVKGPGLAIYDVGVTGLALTAFLVAGYTGRGEHAFNEHVRKGLAYLKSVQDDEGCFGTRVVVPDAEYRGGKGRGVFVYNHATATLAMVEACALTEDAAWQACAQRGIEFIEQARNPYYAWRYGVKPGDNDTSVTGWMMMPLHTARLVNGANVAAGKEAAFQLDEESFDGLKAWIGKATDGDYGRTGYLKRGDPGSRQQREIDRFPVAKSEAMTAVGVLARLFLGEDPRKSELVQKGMELLEALPPEWKEGGSIDMIYWHFGTLAMQQAGGRRKFAPAKLVRRWGKWLEKTESTLLGNQVTEVADLRGSWDPAGAWGSAGGRIYATAINVLTLLTPARYPPPAH